MWKRKKLGYKRQEAPDADEFETEEEPEVIEEKTLGRPKKRKPKIEEPEDDLDEQEEEPEENDSEEELEEDNDDEEFKRKPKKKVLEKEKPKVYQVPVFPTQAEINRLVWENNQMLREILEAVKEE